MTLLDLARRYPTMKRILAINRRRHLVKEWHEKGSIGVEPSKALDNAILPQSGW